jgi:hypothetical protein
MHYPLSKALPRPILLSHQSACSVSPQQETHWRKTATDGDHDEIINLEHTKSMAREIPSAQLAIHREVSHFAIGR